MADRMPGEILIGSNVPRRLLPDLLAALSAQFVGLDWGAAEFSPDSEDDLLAGCVDQQGVSLLRLCHDEACYGAFEVLETFLREHKIPFDRFSDGRYEYDPEWACFRPGSGLHVFTTNTSRERLFAESALARVDQLEQALRRLTSGKLKPALAQLKRTHRGLVKELSSGCAPMPPFQLVGKPATVPSAA